MNTVGFISSSGITSFSRRQWNFTFHDLHFLKDLFFSYYPCSHFCPSIGSQVPRISYFSKIVLNFMSF